MPTKQENDFLASLLAKRAFAEDVAAKTGKNTSAAVKEVDRQIQQALKGDPITGEGVTKSGPED